MAFPVVMTLDGTLASQHRGNTFLGFFACLPGRASQSAFLRAVAWPPAPVLPDGAIGTADCGSRRIEAALRNAGFRAKEFQFAHPDRLDDAVGPETRLLLIGSHDPLGCGPLARMFRALWGGPPPFNARSVARLLASRAVQRYRPLVIAGGAGAWEWVLDAQARDRFGVACAVIGEGETTVPALVRDALEGRPLPPVVEGRTVPVEDIPAIQGPTAGGVVEATRGCGRGCQFCRPNLARLRSLPVAQIRQDVEVNLRAGLRRVSLHAEDIFRYGVSSGFDVNEDALCGLFEEISAVPGVECVSASHATLAGVLARPGVLPRLARILRLGQPGHRAACGLQIGLETGSVTLARQHLGQKMAPFEPDEWPEVVRQGAAHLAENRFYAAYTVIVGLPGETDGDVEDTIRLVRQLRRWPSVIYPLFFVPMTPALSPDRGIQPSAGVTSAQARLIVACFEHNAEWADRIWSVYGRPARRLYSSIARATIRTLTGRMLRAGRRLAVSTGARPETDRGAWFPALAPPEPVALTGAARGTGVGCPVPVGRSAAGAG